MSESTIRILVSAGSRHGATAEIAERIGAVLRERGLQTDVIAPEEVTDLSPYRGVVLGSAVYAGHWVPGARDLARRVARMSPTPEVWLFSSGPIGDPPKPEEDPVDVTEVREQTRSIEHRVFSGKVDKSNLSFPEKAILIAVRAPEGDFREWDRIEAWADEIAESMTREVSHR